MFIKNSLLFISTAIDLFISLGKDIPGKISCQIPKYVRICAKICQTILSFYTIEFEFPSISRSGFAQA